MSNEKLKNYAKKEGVRLWMVAERFGLSDTRFSIKLRHEFSAQDAERFRSYVDQIAAAQEDED